jgi:hypothetical protein
MRLERGRPAYVYVLLRQPLSEQGNLSGVMRFVHLFFCPPAKVWTFPARFFSPAAGGGSIPSVESEAMRRAKQQSPLVRFIWTLMVASVIALVLALSITITSGAGHSFDQIALALPIFFVLLFLATSIGEWLQAEDSALEPKPCFSPSLSRAPPA